MLMQIVTQVSGRITALFSQVYGWIKTLVSTPVSNLLAKFTQASQSVRNLHLLNLLRAQTGLSTNRLIVNLITLEQSISLALTSVRAKLILLGSQLQTTVLQILQLVRQTLSQIKDKLVDLIKLVLLRLSEIKYALTLITLPLTQAGLKLQEIASQLLQRVKALLKVKV